MKKNFTNILFLFRKKVLTAIMKTCLLLFCTTLFSFTPKEVFSQNEKIKIETDQLVTVDEVFKMIKHHTNYTFIYKSDLFKNYGEISLKKGKIKVEKLMRKVLSYGNFISEVSADKTISIKNKPSLVEEDINDVKMQQQVVKGVVVDETGEPLPEVSVSVKGTKRGTFTDFDGKYKIKLSNANEKTVLIFSYLGFEEEEIVVGSKTTINVNMITSLAGLDEVVVIGYGTSKVKDATGVIARIDKKDIEDAPMGTSIEGLLQGKSAGVNVQVQSASPTSPISIIVRGASSLSGNNQPLWVVDGVPQDVGMLEGGESSDFEDTLDGLNLVDVESIDILKDASATAVYGSRAANGVVIITTKKGIRNRAPVFQFSSSVSATINDFNSFEYFDGPQYKEYITAAIKEQILAVGWGGDATNYMDEEAFLALNTSEYDADDLQLLSTAFLDGNTDWQKEVTQNPLNTKHDVSVRGGSDKTSYYVSLGIQDTEGVVKTGYNNRITGSVRLDTDLSENLKFGINLRGSKNKRSNKDGLLDVLNRIRPDFEPYNEDGSVYTPSFYVENPFTSLANINTSKSLSLSTSAYLEYEMLKGLKFKTSFSNSYGDTEYLKYDRRGTYQEELGERTWSNSKRSRDVFDNTLNYRGQIGDKHEITAMLGHSLEKFVTRRYQMEGSDFPDDDLLNNFGSQAGIAEVGESENRSALIGMFTRLHYKYDDRFIVSGTIRRDASSRFGPGKQWGTFPSGAVAWTVSNEKFMQSDKIKQYVTYLKLRTSLGITGSTGSLGYNDWATGIGAETYNNNSVINPSSIGNPNLQWEETTMFDIGLDFGLFDNRISGTIGTYSKESDKLIYKNDLPWSSSERSVYANVGATESRGYEFDLRADIIKSKNSRLTFDFNWSKNTSKLIRLTANIDQLVLYSSDTKMIVDVGDELGEWYGYQSAGRFYVTAEDSYSNRNSVDSDGIQEEFYDTSEGKGDLFYIDNNGDGKITEDDRKHLGSSVPKGYGGFGFSYKYKNFRINTDFTYAYGHLRLWDYPRQVAKYGITDAYNSSVNIAGQSTIMLSPYEAQFPRLTVNEIGGNGLFSDFYLYDASYIRLNSLNMSFAVPKKVFENSKITGLTLSFKASNLFTITNYPGFKPDGGTTSTSSISPYSAQDSSTYPAASVYSLGIQVNLK
jgi:TonB-linked SusC/RagA family outer membrane protein